MYWLFSGMGCAIPIIRRKYEQASISNAATSRSYRTKRLIIALPLALVHNCQKSR